MDVTHDRYIIYALSVEGKTEAKGITQVNATVDIVNFFATQVPI